MKVSYSWLQDYLPDLPPPAELEDVFTRLGLTVEGTSIHGLVPLENVVVGEVLEREQHPDADRLSVCKVRVAAVGDPVQIVCGASNFKVGDRVPVALPGATLPGGFKIGRTKLRGVESQGMMCSARELGLGNDHEGLLIMAGRPEAGRPINAYFPEPDTVFDLEVTPNRPDCLSHVGVAREVAAALGMAVQYPEVALGTAAPGDPADIIRDVRVDWPEHCPHYRAYAIRGVKVAPSPGWLRARLEAIGLRPINNVVDATNYVLHELGQPLHAFDAAKIGGRQIVVRAARQGEVLLTLDGRKRELQPRMAVIADAERAMVVAGVMGGEDAEVGEGTTDVVLEAAWFNPARTRWTSRRLGLSTDSSYRFERGVDPEGTEYAALRALELIIELAGATWVGAPLVAGTAPQTRREIEISGDYVRTQLGFEIADDEIGAIFAALNLEPAETVREDGEPVWRLKIPGYRADLERPIDLVEEVIRLYGCDRIPPAPVKVAALVHRDAPQAVYVRESSRLMVARGFQECLHYALREEDEIRRWYRYADAATLRLDNPLAADQTHLRTSVLPGLLDALRLNLNRGRQPDRLFEVGRVFREHQGQIFELLAVGFTVLKAPRARAWRTREEPDVPLMQAQVRQLLTLAGVPEGEQVFSLHGREDVWAPGHGAEAGNLFERGWTARVGQINPRALKDWDLNAEVLAGAVYFLPEFLKGERERRRFAPFSVFPAAPRDLALVVPGSTPAGEVRDTVAAAARAIVGDAFTVEDVSVFDVYEGDGLPEGTKSLAFALVFRATNRTLTDEEVNGAMQRLQARLAETTPYRLRG